MAKQYWVEFDEEIHCDLCNEVIHIHFDCPKCGTKHAKTDVYGMSLLDLLTEKEGRFECQHCKTKFKLGKESEDDWRWQVEKIEPVSLEQLMQLNNAYPGMQYYLAEKQHGSLSSLIFDISARSLYWHAIRYDVKTYIKRQKGKLKSQVRAYSGNTYLG